MKIIKNCINIKIRSIFRQYQDIVNAFKDDRAGKVIFSNRQNFRILNFLFGLICQQIVISFKI